MEYSPRKPDRTIRIFSSEDHFLRVARRISRFNLQKSRRPHEVYLLGDTRQNYTNGFGTPQLLYSNVEARHRGKTLNICFQDGHVEPLFMVTSPGVGMDGVLLNESYRVRPWWAY
jgi:prepilin-type processing-associated H-X9-DG protein